MSLPPLKTTSNPNVKDTGWSKGIIEAMEGMRITVGVHQQDDTRDDGLGNADIGFRHEYGVGVPERSFLRSTVDNKTRKLQKTTAFIFSKMLSDKISAGVAYDMLGMAMVSEVKKTIRSNISPALAQSTIDRKGSSLALVDTSALINAIDYEVES